MIFNILASALCFEQYSVSSVAFWTLPTELYPIHYVFVARFVLAYWNTRSADIEWQIALSCIVPKLKNKTEAQNAVELIT